MSKLTPERFGIWDVTESEPFLYRWMTARNAKRNKKRWKPADHNGETVKFGHLVLMKRPNPPPD